MKKIKVLFISAFLAGCVHEEQTSSQTSSIPSQTPTEQRAAPAADPGPVNQTSSTAASAPATEPPSPSVNNETTAEGYSEAALDDINPELLFDSDDTAPIQEILKSGKQDLSATEETLSEFNTESRGSYFDMQKKLKSCKTVPVDVVWKEFSPFFSYKWSPEFKQFAALFLALWERESLYTLPTQGVLVASNCKNKKASFIKALAGKNMEQDLISAKKKDLTLSSHYAGCNMNLADYGPMQWNHHYRLNNIAFRHTMEKALLLSGKYKKKDIQKIRLRKITDLIKYNPKALFILGGLSIREGASKPKATIHAYNSSKEYRSTVLKRRNEFMTMLDNKKKCQPPSVARLDKK